MYQLLYHPRAVKFLKKLPQKEASRVFQKISLLTADPVASKLDVKKLATTKRSYRLRVGSLRVIYEVDFEKQCLYIHEINWRGNIY